MAIFEILTKSVSIMSLNLVPNEIVGYRIKPDWYCFNVVLVKRYGPNSKRAGQEYDTVLAHCKSLPFAVQWLTAHAIRMYGEISQKEVERLTGSVADAAALEKAVSQAQAAALAAISDLDERISNSGIPRADLIKHLGR